jgi:hypothetical protein
VKGSGFKLFEKEHDLNEDDQDAEKTKGKSGDSEADGAIVL